MADRWTSTTQSNRFFLLQNLSRNSFVQRVLVLSMYSYPISVLFKWFYSIFYNNFNLISVRFRSGQTRSNFQIPDRKYIMRLSASSEALPSKTYICHRKCKVDHVDVFNLSLIKWCANKRTKIECVKLFYRKPLSFRSQVGSKDGTINLGFVGWGRRLRGNFVSNFPRRRSRPPGTVLFFVADWLFFIWFFSFSRK